MEDFNVLVSQAVCLVIIVALFIYVFRKYPLKGDVRSLVYASMFVVTSVALNALSLTIPFFGVPSVKIGFTYIPLLMCGFFISPSWALLVGLTMDIIGLMITPSQYPFLGFTLNHVLAACLPALFVQTSAILEVAKVQKIVKTVLVTLACCAITYLIPLNEVSVNGTELEFTIMMKLGIILYIIMVCIMMLIMLTRVETRFGSVNSDVLAKWMLVSILAELLINMTLTPMWLDIMYGIPFIFSLFIRSLKACVMVGLNIVIGFSCMNILKRIIKMS